AALAPRSGSEHGSDRRTPTGSGTRQARARRSPATGARYRLPRPGTYRTCRRPATSGTAAPVDPRPGPSAPARAHPTPTQLRGGAYPWERSSVLAALDDPPIGRVVVDLDALAVGTLAVDLVTGARNLERVDDVAIGLDPVLHGLFAHPFAARCIRACRPGDHGRSEYRGGDCKGREQGLHGDSSISGQLP